MKRIKLLAGESRADVRIQADLGLHACFDGNGFGARVGLAFTNDLSRQRVVMHGSRVQNRGREDANFRGRLGGSAVDRDRGVGRDIDGDESRGRERGHATLLRFDFRHFFLLLNRAARSIVNRCADASRNRSVADAAAVAALVLVLAEQAAFEQTTVASIATTVATVAAIAASNGCSDVTVAATAVAAATEQFRAMAAAAEQAMSAAAAVAASDDHTLARSPDASDALATRSSFRGSADRHHQYHTVHANRSSLGAT